MRRIVNEVILNINILLLKITFCLQVAAMENA